MGSSDHPTGDAARELGTYLGATEAGALAARLGDGDTLTEALTSLPATRRPRARQLLAQAGLGPRDLAATVAVLRAIEGARSVVTAVEPIWTMPAHLAQTGPLTSSAVRMVEGARSSVTCSTFNFQRTSGLWDALGEAAARPGLRLRVYVDARAAGRSAAGTPSTAELAKHVRPGIVLQTKRFDGSYVRNHAKYVVVDHRFVLVTSANFSWSAEYGNVEFGVRLDNPSLAEAVERETRRAEDSIYERVES